MSDIRDPERDQAAPVHNDGASMHNLVALDLEERKAHGLRKYDTVLQANNGRSFRLDAYEEALDLVCYLRGILEEERQDAPDDAEDWHLVALLPRSKYRFVRTPEGLAVYSRGDESFT